MSGFLGIRLKSGKIPELQTRPLVHGAIHGHAIVNGQRELDGESNGTSGMTTDDGDSIQRGLIPKRQRQMCVDMRLVI